MMMLSYNSNLYLIKISKLILHSHIHSLTHNIKNILKISKTNRNYTKTSTTTTTLSSTHSNPDPSIC